MQNLRQGYFYHKKMIQGEDYGNWIIDFYKFIEKYTIIPYKYFPMVFNKGVFVGGYKEWLNFKNTKI